MSRKPHLIYIMSITFSYKLCKIDKSKYLDLFTIK